MNSLLRQIVPPALIGPAQRVRDQLRRDDSLFDGDDALFKKIVADAAVYAEYGCGASTRWVAGNTTSRVLSVDTSRDWIDAVRSSVGDRAELHWTDLGKLGDWGRPVSYAHRDRFADYTDWIWEQGVTPDVVLVDGRFRVACFLTSLANATPGTRIFFDDYAERPYYHVVEDVLPIAERCGRQALFVVPEDGGLDRAAIADLLAHFRYVMD